MHSPKTFDYLRLSGGPPSKKNNALRPVLRPSITLRPKRSEFNLTLPFGIPFETKYFYTASLLEYLHDLTLR